MTAETNPRKVSFAQNPFCLVLPRSCWRETVPSAPASPPKAQPSLPKPRPSPHPRLGGGGNQKSPQPRVNTHTQGSPEKMPAHPSSGGQSVRPSVSAALTDRSQNLEACALSQARTGPDRLVTPIKDPCSCCCCCLLALSPLVTQHGGAGTAATRKQKKRQRQTRKK